MIYLLDVNLLFAFHLPTQSHNQSARSWYRKKSLDQFATCSITQCGLIRLLMLNVDGFSYEFDEANTALKEFVNRPQHIFWANLPPVSTLIQPIAHRLQGHRQITDAYLLGLAAHHKARLATLDKGVIYLAGREFADFVELIS
jgi:predicted nucleic acid-binding protein